VSNSAVSASETTRTACFSPKVWTPFCQGSTGTLPRADWNHNISKVPPAVYRGVLSFDQKTLLPVMDTKLSTGPARRLPLQGSTGNWFEIEGVGKYIESLRSYCWTTMHNEIWRLERTFTCHGLSPFVE
jgi:hypothetical protein